MVEKKQNAQLFQKTKFRERQLKVSNHQHCTLSQKTVAQLTQCAKMTQFHYDQFKNKSVHLKVNVLFYASQEMYPPLFLFSHLCILKLCPKINRWKFAAFMWEKLALFWTHLFHCENYWGHGKSLPACLSRMENLEGLWCEAFLPWTSLRRQMLTCSYLFNGPTIFDKTLHHWVTWFNGMVGMAW